MQTDQPPDRAPTDPTDPTAGTSRIVPISWEQPKPSHVPGGQVNPAPPAPKQQPPRQ